MALNLQSSRNGDDDEEREKETTSMSPDQIDTEAAVNLWPSHNEYNDKEEEKETASMSPEQMEESISDTEEVPSGANPYETTPEPLSGGLNLIACLYTKDLGSAGHSTTRPNHYASYISYTSRCLSPTNRPTVNNHL